MHLRSFTTIITLVFFITLFTTASYAQDVVVELSTSDGTTGLAIKNAAGVEVARIDSSGTFTGNTGSSVPPGAVMAYAVATPPQGWLECNGSAVSRTTYADLFAAIGTMYGPGDGSTTFNLPDFGRTYKARSVIFDFRDNWSGVNMGVRSVEFKNDATLIPFNSNWQVFVTSREPHPLFYLPINLFDPSKPKTGYSFHCWITPQNVKTFQRLIVVFPEIIEFDEIVINNYHSLGSQTEYGVRATEITISTDSISDTTYNAPIANSKSIFSGTIEKHVSLDTVDDNSYCSIPEIPAILSANYIIKH